MVDFKTNNDCGLERIIIVLDEQKGTYTLKAQNPYSDKIDYHSIVYGIKDIETAKKVKEAYIRGLYDGEEYTLREVNKSCQTQ